MAIGKAIRFVKKAQTDPEFRKSCYVLSKADLLVEMGFDELEFDDAINMQLVKCQTYQEAEVYQQIRMWFLAM